MYKCIYELMLVLLAVVLLHTLSFLAASFSFVSCCFAQASSSEVNVAPSPFAWVAISLMNLVNSYLVMVPFLFVSMNAKRLSNLSVVKVYPCFNSSATSTSVISVLERALPPAVLFFKATKIPSTIDLINGIVVKSEYSFSKLSLSSRLSTEVRTIS